jgi:hypothetical protein
MKAAKGKQASVINKMFINVISIFQNHQTGYHHQDSSETDYFLKHVARISRQDNQFLSTCVLFQIVHTYK